MSSSHLFTNGEAVRVVIAAIESGQAKLVGATQQTENSPTSAALRGQVDAAYLVSLLKHLQTGSEATGARTP